MPNRIIREGWVDSEPIDNLSAESERFFLRLVLKADDYGRFHGSHQLLKTSLYPLKNSVRNTDIAHWLAECETAGLVRCYTIEQKAYIWIVKFRQRFRLKRPSKFPDPPWPTNDSHVTDTRPSAAYGDGDGDGDVVESEYGGGDVPAPTREVAWPSLEEWKAAASMAGLVEWVAIREWHYQEKLNPPWRGVGDWHKQLAFTKADWEQKGRPMTPNANTRTGNQQRANRNVGTANEGNTGKYAGLGKVAKP